MRRLTLFKVGIVAAIYVGFTAWVVIDPVPVFGLAAVIGGMWWVMPLVFLYATACRTYRGTGFAGGGYALLSLHHAKGPEELLGGGLMTPFGLLLPLYTINGVVVFVVVGAILRRCRAWVQLRRRTSTGSGDS